MTSPETKAAAGHRAPTDAARQTTYVDFLFFKLDPVYRRRPVADKRKGAESFLNALTALQKTHDIRTYSCMGWRDDADFLLWVITKDPDNVQQVLSELYRTELGGYLNLAYSYLALTKPTPYSREHTQNFEQGPSKAKYLFVYPFTKTHAWYQLPFEQRKKMMVQHLMIGSEFPNIKVNTTYAFGLGDQDFVLAFDADDPREFLELVQKLRESEARPYTANDTPLLMCIRNTAEQILTDLALL